MKQYILIFIIFSSVLNSFGLEKECKQIISKEIIIKNIDSYCSVLDEWKNPGLYSPVKIFDSDTNTCFAEDQTAPNDPSYGTNYIRIRVTFKNPVYVDEIRIMNGFTKNAELFKNNNRIKKLLINIPPNPGFTKTILILEDKREFQSFKFDKSYLIEFVTIDNDGKDESIYKGEKYDDTCITEIEFYNQGKKIPVKNIKEAKKNYLLGLKYFLEDIASGKQSEYKKYKWKVEDYKLYKYKNGKWLLTKYFISDDESVEAFDEYGNCSEVSHDSDSSKCYRFEVKGKK